MRRIYTQAELQELQQRRYSLVALAESFGDQLDADDRFVVWDYVDHNQMGIAFDHLLYRLFDEPVRAVTVTPEQAEELHALGKAMSYSSDSDIVYRIFLAQHFPQEV